MNITCLIFSLIFLVIAILLLNGKVYLFIPNYKNLSEEEKENLNLKGFNINMAIVVAVGSFILLLSGLSAYFREHLFSIAMVLYLIASGVNVYVIEKKERQKKNK